MSLEYAWEKVQEAILGMAVSRETMRYRLYHAYVSHLIRIKEDDLPPDCIPIYQALK